MHKYILPLLLVVANPSISRADPADVAIKLLIGFGGVVGVSVLGLPMLGYRLLKSPRLQDFVSNDQAFNALAHDWHTLPDNAKDTMKHFAHKAAINGNPGYQNQIEALEKSTDQHQ